jgi:RNA polymerase sigma-70 factor, ECF subfamily
LLVTEKSLEQDQDTVHWIQSAIDGNLHAFEMLYQRYHQRLFLYAKRMTGSVPEAEEVVQDTFVKTWQKLSSFRAESQFYTWLRKIASRVVIDRLRVKNAKIWQDSTEYDDIHPSVGQSLGKQRDLEKLIAALPDGAKTVFVMHDVEGYTHVEIAELAGVAVGTSKAQLFRARKILRESL